MIAWGQMAKPIFMTALLALVLGGDVVMATAADGTVMFGVAL